MSAAQRGAAAGAGGPSIGRWATLSRRATPTLSNFINRAPIVAIAPSMSIIENARRASAPVLRNFGNFVHAAPLSGDIVLRFLRFATQHASETAAVDGDSLQHFAAFADAYASLVGNIGVPDGVIGIDADAVRDAVTEVSPHAPVRQTSVGGDGKRGQLLTNVTRRRSRSNCRALWPCHWERRCRRPLAEASHRRSAR